LCQKLEITAGDSKIIIDWFNGDSALNAMHLQHWKEKVWDIRSRFSSIQFFHIHRIYNSEADRLSKLGLTSDLGKLFVQEFVDEVLISSTTFALF